MNNNTRSAVGIDVGYGYVKAVDYLLTETFPSIRGAAINIGFRSDIAASNAGMTIIRDGCRYFVGDLARLQSPDAASPLTRRRDLDMVLDFTLTALARLNITSVRSLATGLPVSWYAKDKDALIEKLTGSHDMEYNGTPMTFSLDRVRVMPQPWGTVIDHVIAVDGNGIATAPDPLRLTQPYARVGVVDVGTHNTNFLLCEGLDYIEEGSRSPDQGCASLYQSVARDISERYDGIELSPPEAERATHTQKITLAGNTVNVSDICEYAINEFASNTISTMRSLWDRDIGKLSYLFVTGGGSHLIFNQLREAVPMAQHVDGATAANARGFYKYALWKAQEETR